MTSDNSVGMIQRSPKRLQPEAVRCLPLRFAAHEEERAPKTWLGSEAGNIHDSLMMYQKLETKRPVRVGGRIERTHGNRKSFILSACHLSSRAFRETNYIQTRIVSL